jgi:hypothetical protein
MWSYPSRVCLVNLLDYFSESVSKPSDLSLLVRRTVISEEAIDVLLATPVGESPLLPVSFAKDWMGGPSTVAAASGGDVSVAASSRVIFADMVPP